MQHFILRCKHCQKEYTYCTYGNGPEYGTEAGCSMDYCAECQKAIDAAFRKIPVKFEDRGMEIEEFRLFPLFEQIKEKHFKDHTSLFPMCVSFDRDNGDFDWVETYYHDGKRFDVKWREGEKKHVFLFMEYDILNKKFTDKVWRYKCEDSYTIKEGGRRIRKRWESSIKELEKINPVPMSEPTGTLFFIDCPDLIKTNSKENEIKKEHVLKKFEFVDDGDGIRRTEKCGWYNKKCKIEKGINIKKLSKYLQYKCYCIQYEDEDFATIYEIECV